MSHELLQEKLDSVGRCLARVKEKTPQTVEGLKDDIDIQDIITLNLERLVQLCVDISLIVLSEKNTAVPATMAEGFALLADVGVISDTIAERMAKAAGFRNIAVHAYRKIDWDIVWKIITEHLEDFHVFSASIIKSIGKNVQK